MDECLSVDLVAVAGESGHEAQHVAHIGRAGWKDWNVVRYAHAGDFILVTNNASDFRQLYSAQLLHAGLIILIPVINRVVQRQLFKAALDELAVIGEPVKGRRVIMFDDIIDTGGSIIGAAQRLQDEGALDVELRCTHGLFNGDAIERFRDAGLRVVMLETVSRPQSFHENERSWLTILPIDEMLSDAMHQTMQVGGSVSQLVR